MVYIPELDRQGFADRQSIKNRRPRPAINFTQRDDVRDFARSGPGRNYFAMENLQAQAPSFASGDPRIDELKKRRRLRNRYQKYPAGEILGKTPQQMQNEYMGLSRDLRQTAKPAYNKMYPLTGGFMDYADKGGIWGAMLSNFLGGKGKEIKKNIKSIGDRIGGGISNFIDDDKEKEEYAAKTFPFYPSDVHPEGEPSLVPDVFTPEVETREDKIQGLKDELQGQIDNFENPFPLLPTQEDIDDAEQDRMDDYYGKSEQGEMVFADVPEKDDWFMAPPDDIEPLPFDQGKEDYIRRQNEYVSPPPVFPGNIRQDPQDTDKYLKWLNYRPPLKFPPIGPHDPFDPDQNMFENREEYDAWLRRQRLGY